MNYKIEYTISAREGFRKLFKSEPKAYKKAISLLNELAEHPYFALASLSL